jgi:hypothetical protein
MNLAKFLDGKNPRKFDLILTYLVSSLFAMLLLYLAFLQNLHWSLIQNILAFALIADVLGGVTSNLSPSTNQFYQNSKILSLIFLLVHFIQPLLLVLFFGFSWQFFWFIYLYMLASSLLVRFVFAQKFQRQLAGLLIAVGFVNLSFLIPINFLAWFGFVYFFKLIYAFSVKHF